MDMSDLYDYEIAEIGQIWNELNRDWMHKANTRGNLEEFAKTANAKFLEAGFVVNIQWENSLIMVPDISAPGGMSQMPVTIEVLGRAPGAKGAEHATDGFDHERKRHEVLRSKERGEDFYGQKESATG